MAINRVISVVGVCLVPLILAGCASFGEGLGRAILSQMQGDPEVDRRTCEIKGARFDGILAALKEQDGQGPIGNAPASERIVVKLMMVHGIGSHHPGYSGRTVANLTSQLGLNVLAPQIKSVDLMDRDFPDEPMGTLTAQRFTDNARERELVVYELTWSRISDYARSSLEFDSSEIHTRHRAPLNRVGKTFINDKLVDPLIYVGVGRNKILNAVRQGMCWAYSTDWDSFPQARAICKQEDHRYGSRLQLDRFFFVTHSLGSQIVLDALQTTAEAFYAQLDSDTKRSSFLTNLQKHSVTVFMMANQLPLLQSGLPPAPVTGQIAAYCRPEGPLYRRRIVAQTRVIAFSDPNDLLSYPIPDDFIQYGVDSRLCPISVNVALNIAQVSRLAAIDGFASPLTAHSGYNDDERVIGLMTGGLGTPETSPAVIERCNWVQVEETLR